MDLAPPRSLRKGDVGAALARWSLVVVLVWTGAMRFTAYGASAMETVLTENRLLSGTVGAAGALAVTSGILQVGAGLLLAVGRRPGLRLRVGALLSAFLAVVPLTLFFTAPVWIESMGGFPYIGSGQGLLKYVPILGVSLYLCSEAYPPGAPQRAGLCRFGKSVMLVGLILVLGWIGAMKFTAVEAAGIEPLLRTSPFMSWLLVVFSTQGASNFIGMTELVTVAFLATWWLRPSLFVWGAALAFATFATTLTFLVTLPGWHPEIGFPAIGGTGQFLLKDLVLVAAVLILLVERPMGSGAGQGEIPDRA
jgi:uncharacterized membrane protein YkgB